MKSSLHSIDSGAAALGAIDVHANDYQLAMADTEFKVLAADDDPTILNLLTNILQAPGIRVEVTTNGSDALASIERDPPDILIADWDMPGIDGPELCRRVRSLELPHYLYVLFLTVKTGSQDRIAGFEAGADDFVSKPIVAKELLARLRAGARVIVNEKQLRTQTITDPLTGLATKRTLTQRCAEEWSRARRHGGSLSCVMLDVDFFKRVNDMHGHAVGDNVLTAVADVIRRESRESDFACRYGGEEFCMLLVQTNRDEAILWSERVRNAIGALRFPVGDTVIKVTASCGVATLSEAVFSPVDLIGQADRALRVAKIAGRDRVVHIGDLSHDGQPHSASADYEDPFEGLKAGAIMMTPVACLVGTDTITAAIDYFLRHRISSAPVVDHKGKLIGILSEKDCITVMCRPVSWRLSIADVMRSNVVCYDEETPVKMIYDFFCRVSIRRVVIVRDGRPEGVISRGTLLRWYHLWVKKRCQADTVYASTTGSREHIQHLADFLAEESSTIRDKLHASPDATVPIILEGAARIQETIAGLLAASRPPSPPDCGPVKQMPIL